MLTKSHEKNTPATSKEEGEGEKNSYVD